MPELPEVEVVKRSLNNKARNLIVKTVKKMTSHVNYVILDIRSKMENVSKKKTNIIVIQINVRNVM